MRRVPYVCSPGSITNDGSTEQGRYVCEFARPGKIVAISVVTSLATGVANANTKVLIRDDRDKAFAFTGQSNGSAYIPFAAISPANGERFPFHKDIKRSEKVILVFSVAAAAGAAVTPTVIFFVDEEED